MSNRGVHRIANVTLRQGHASLTGFYTLMGGCQHLTLIPMTILQSCKTYQCMLEHACVILKQLVHLLGRGIVQKKGLIVIRLVFRKSLKT